MQRNNYYLASAVEIYQKLLPSPELFDQELACYKLHYMLISKDNCPDSCAAAVKDINDGVLGDSQRYTRDIQKL